MTELITVFVVDSDASIRRSMARMMRVEGFEVVCFPDLDTLLQQDIPSSNVILLLDVRTTNPSGDSLQDYLSVHGLNPPIIFLADCDQSATLRRARELGAAAYFQKPVDKQALLDAILFAVPRDSATAPNVAPGSI